MKKDSAPPDAPSSSGSPCPTCGTPVDKARVGRLAPFCSPRCQQIDLGRWLGGDYVVSQHAVPQQELATAQRLAALAKRDRT